MMGLQLSLHPPFARTGHSAIKQEADEADAPAVSAPGVRMTWRARIRDIATAASQSMDVIWAAEPASRDGEWLSEAIARDDAVSATAVPTPRRAPDRTPSMTPGADSALNERCGRR